MVEGYHSQKMLHVLHISGNWALLDWFEVVWIWEDPFDSNLVPKDSDFFLPEDALGWLNP